MGITIANVAVEQRRSILALFGDHLVNVQTNGIVEFIWTDAKECLDEFDRVIDAAFLRTKGGWGYLAETALLNGTRRKIAVQVDWAKLESDAEDGYLAQGIEL